MKGAIVVDTERCKGCQLCIIACPQKVIAMAGKVNLHGYPGGGRPGGAGAPARR